MVQVNSIWAKASLSLAIMASAVEAQNITDDSYFYGQSPPIYPSPDMPGTASWQSAHAKAVAVVSHNSTLYLTTTGTITNNITLAATCYLQFNSLYIGTSGSLPVGVAIGSLSTRLIGFQGANEQGVIYTTWGVDSNQTLSWKNTAFTKQGGDGTAHFWVRMNSIGDVFAIMGGAMTADSVPAKLKAIYLWDLYDV